jgi:hypothetical protein
VMESIVDGGFLMLGNLRTGVLWRMEELSLFRAGSFPLIPAFPLEEKG